MNCLLFQETNQQKGHLPMIGRILVALGAGPSSSSAIQQAIELARLHGAELTAVALFDLPRLSHVGRAPIGAAMAGVELRRYRLTTAEQSLDEAIAEFEAACLVAGLSHRVCREEGDPIDRLVALSRYHDVVVAGLHGLLEWGVIDEPPDELIELIGGGVRPIIAAAQVVRRIRRVMIAYSGSVESASTMKRFIQFRIWSDVHIKLVTFSDDADRGERLLADAAHYCRSHGYGPELEVIPGSPKHHLLEHAQAWHADLLVVGNSAQSLLRRRLFGETALHVVRHAELPLFLSQ